MMYRAVVVVRLSYARVAGSAARNRTKPTACAGTSSSLFHTRVNSPPAASCTSSTTRSSSARNLSQLTADRPSASAYARFTCGHIDSQCARARGQAFSTTSATSDAAPTATSSLCDCMYAHKSGSKRSRCTATHAFASRIKFGNDASSGAAYAVSVPRKRAQSMARENVLRYSSIPASLATTPVNAHATSKACGQTSALAPINADRHASSNTAPGPARQSNPVARLDSALADIAPLVLTPSDG
mmetsp:Transcript_7323/g.29422  ORF Transcript_7323/g.29422 Transcript_7323/m.29422 type:complete len:243 (-) Transcript_7323:663-1391(-)